MADQIEKILSVKFDAQQAIKGMMSLNQQIEQNNADLKEMAQNGEKGTKAYAELEAQTKGLRKQKQDLGQVIQNEIKVQNTLDGSLRQLRAQLSTLTKQYDALSKSERENVNIGGKLQKQINDVTKEIKDAEFSTQRYYRNVGNYQQSILNAIGLNGRFGQSIINITNVEGGVSGAFKSMGASAKAFGASLMALLSNPVFLAIAGIAGVGLAFKWWYDYNEGLAEATRLTREFTGYTGDNLIAMRNSIKATSDVMGKDFNDTLKTADALMANYHLTGEQAMDVINKGFASGADLNGDMLAKIQQLSPTFHDAGIAADEMVAILSQTRSGIFTDQGLEAIRQGSARIREMSSSTRQALQGIGIDVDAMQAKLRDGSMSTFDAIKQVSAQLKTLPDNAQEVGEVMTAVFGRQGKFASQEMIESLAEMSTNLDEVTARTGEYGELLLENISTEEELDQVTSALFDMTGKGWEEAKQKATIYAKKALVEVVKGIFDIVNWMIRLYNQSTLVRGAVNYIILGFKQLWEACKFIFGSIIELVKQTGIGFEALAGLIEGIFSLDADKVINGWKKAQNAFTNAWSNVAKKAYDFGKLTADNAVQAYNDTINNAQIQELSLSAFTGLGGGGGGSSTSTGGNGSKGGSSKGGGGSRRGGTSRTSSPKPGKSDAEKQAEKEEAERIKRLQALLKKAQELEQKAYEEQARQSAEGIVELYKQKTSAVIDEFDSITTKSDEEAQGLAKARTTMLKHLLDEQQKELEKFKAGLDKKRAEEQKKAEDDAKKLAQTLLDSTKEGTQEHLNYQLQILEMEKQAELAIYENNEAMKAAIVAKYAKQEADARKQYSDQQIAIEQTKYEAISGIVGGLGEIFGAFGEKNKEFLVLQKTLALAEIMIAQAVAIANAVKAGSNAVNPWQLIAQIATSVVAVTTAMVQAFNALDSAKFATGGYIRGAGTSTSDSIPVRVSNGESVMNANTTAMFSGLLSSLNQLGGGVPIQAENTASSVKGEDMLARAVARGVAMLPAPVVSVEDINRGQRQVKVMNERATL